MLKSALAAVAGAAVLFSNALFASAQAADATAMMFYADWCGPCQILKPALEQAVETYEGGEIEILYLDFTSMDFENVFAQAERADKIGAADEVNLAGIRTGYALIIIDGETKGRVSAGMDAATIKMMFDAALAR